MSFSIDKQTNSDLNLSGRYKTDNIFNIYNNAITSSGSLFIEQLFLSPLTNVKDINDRKAIFISLKNFSEPFPVSDKELREMDEFLKSTDYSLYVVSFMQMTKTKIISMLSSDKKYEYIVDGINLLCKFIKKANDFFVALEPSVKGTIFEKSVSEQVKLLSEPNLYNLFDKEVNSNDLLKVIHYNRLIRYRYGNKLLNLIKVLSQADGYISVAKKGNSKGYSYAEAIDGDTAFVDIYDVRHPRVKGAIGNDIKMDADSNIIFLTGANMAGKSTIMKSFGIALYLAHIGFPLTANKMTFVPLEGIYTSINVPDDISQGYSHFYAEVIRVKNVVNEIATGKPMLIIFDELFKGTNVKDAFDGTYEITKELANSDKCLFIISTHIMEVGDELKGNCNNIQFKLMPTSMNEDSTPKYTYKMVDGIADDRYGMHIINNEKIIEIIKGAM